MEQPIPYQVGPIDSRPNQDYVSLASILTSALDSAALHEDAAILALDLINREQDRVLCRAEEREARGIEMTDFECGYVEGLQNASLHIRAAIKRKS